MARYAERTLENYPFLREIQDDEWEDFFPPRKPWSEEDDSYLLEWYGRENIVHLSYALEEPPWKVGARYRELKKAQEKAQHSVH